MWARRTERHAIQAELPRAVIVWVGILAASAVMLARTPYFGQMLPILAGGIVWFVVIVPGALFRDR